VVSGYIIHKCPVEVMVVSFGTRCMLALCVSVSKNLQKDRHMTPKCAICFKIDHTNRKHECIDVQCTYMRKTAFLRFINLKLKFCFPRPPPELCPWTRLGD